MLPGVSNNGCCTDDEQPSEIAISPAWMCEPVSVSNSLLAGNLQEIFSLIRQKGIKPPAGYKC